VNAREGTSVNDSREGTPVHVRERTSVNAPREGTPVTSALTAKYDRPGPRYTSYPTAVEFHAGVDADVYAAKLAEADAQVDAPLSMYVHLPFCEERCTYCGCNVVITKHRDVAAQYLEYLEREIDLLAAHLSSRRAISQLHWGGGTPTYFTADQLERLFGRIGAHFSFTPEAEIGVEIDPRVTSEAQLAALRRCGFNRLSMGVQDFAPEVQQAVNRIQSYEQTRDLIEAARGLGYRSINVDLIYGLPYQTPAAFTRTLDQVLTLAPDRVAVYSFAFVPWMKAHMTHIPESALPMADEKLALLGLARTAFEGAGYVTIGIDHFACPDDELARAVSAGTLGRNFMGYTVQSARDMVGLGVSAIGDVQGAFVQHTKKLTEYYRALDDGRFPVERGYLLDADDRIRRHVITELMCNGRVDGDDVERRFGIRFADYFAAELDELAGARLSPAEDRGRASGAMTVPSRNRHESRQRCGQIRVADSALSASPEDRGRGSQPSEARPLSLAEDGLVIAGPDGVEVTPLGRSFVRNVCMIFDRYLRVRTAGPTPVFSRTV
jgi:oxygen-independent coproporphyrinogen-3 oxidase